jgi:hypothetical protein
VERVTEQFEYGDKVEHPVFGIGQVLAFIGDGERLKLLIKFRDHGEKKIAVRHARLKRLSDRPTLATTGSASLPARAETPVQQKYVPKTVLPAADATKDYDSLDTGDHDDAFEDDDESDEEYESLEELEEDEDEDEDDD